MIKVKDYMLITVLSVILPESLKCDYDTRPDKLVDDRGGI